VGLSLSKELQWRTRRVRGIVVQRLRLEMVSPQMRLPNGVQSGTTSSGAHTVRAEDTFGVGLSRI
jgi:hypothetical protein